MSTTNYPRYEVDVIIRQYTYKGMGIADDQPPIEEMTQEMKHLKLGWREALKIIFDQFI